MPAVFHVRSYDELLNTLATIPRPERGHTRVYRGQTRRYFLDPERRVDSLLPAVLRQDSDDSPGPDPVWLSAAILLAESFRRQARHLSATKVAHLVLASAHLQHYGAGSSFLDVTKNLSVALWFATHRLGRYDDNYRCASGEYGPWVGFTDHWYDALVAPSGKNGRESESAASTEDIPVLYVFDVKPWDGFDRIESGQLVDVLDHWYGFRGINPSASRITVQEAALLVGYRGAFATEMKSTVLKGRLDTITYPFAGGPPESLNLHQFLTAICALEIPFQAPSEVGLDRDTLELFPLPDEDEVYRALLSVPLMIDVSDKAKQNLRRGPKLKRAFEIPEYHSCPSPHVDETKAQSRGYGKECIRYSKCDRFVRPVLFFPWVLQQPEMTKPVEVDGHLFDVTKAVPIILECSFFYDLPIAYPDRKGLWNHESLATNLPDEVGEIRLDNVFVELSSLDVWPPGKADDKSCVRAIWTVRKGDEYAVTMFRTHVAGEIQHFRLTRDIRYSSQSQRFECVLTRSCWKRLKEWILGNPREDEWVERVTVVEPMQGLFLTLKLFHDLAPEQNESVTLRIPVEDGSEIQALWKNKPVILQKWEGPYYVPKTAGGRPYSPRISGIGDFEIKV